MWPNTMERYAQYIYVCLKTDAFAHFSRERCHNFIIKPIYTGDLLQGHHICMALDTSVHSYEIRTHVGSIMWCTSLRVWSCEYDDFQLEFCAKA